jgi:hypothetical protein
MCCAQLAPALRTIRRYSISYVAALFKDPHFQAEAAEMIEAAKPETLAPIMIASNSIMPLPSAEVDCRLFVIFATFVVERQSAGSLVCRFGA